MGPFEYEVTLAVRWRDCDPMGHVNNAVYATYLEHARINYLRDVAGLNPQRDGLVIASLSLDFHESLEMNTSVTIGVRVDDIGNTSMGMEYEIRSEGTLVAEAETQFVNVDRETGTPERIPTAWRERIQEFESA